MRESASSSCRGCFVSLWNLSVPIRMHAASLVAGVGQVRAEYSSRDLVPAAAVDTAIGRGPERRSLMNASASVPLPRIQPPFAAHQRQPRLDDHPLVEERAHCWQTQLSNIARNTIDSGSSGTSPSASTNNADPRASIMLTTPSG